MVSAVGLRRYGTRCARCGRNIGSSDWVRRVRGSTFHLACFSCSSCKRQLSTGEECGLLENRVFCRRHYGMVMENIKRVKKNGESAQLWQDRPTKVVLKWQRTVFGVCIKWLMVKRSFCEMHKWFFNGTNYNGKNVSWQQHSCTCIKIIGQ